MAKTPMYLKFDTELLDRINAVVPRGERTRWLEAAARRVLADDVEAVIPITPRRSGRSASPEVRPVDTVRAMANAATPREREDIRRQGNCAHTYELKASMGRKVCTSCGTLKP